MSLDASQLDAINRGIQVALKQGEFYPGKIDGRIGPKSRAAVTAWLAALDAPAESPLAPRPSNLPPRSPRPSTLPLRASAPGWDHIDALIDGPDIVIRNARVSVFGGLDDSVDGIFRGQTASGKVNTARQPEFLGCALPMHRSANPALAGSPLPRIPWLTRVRFTDLITGQHIETQLIDEGPAKRTGKAGDLMVSAARRFDPKATANAANIPPLEIRILGAAQFVG